MNGSCEKQERVTLIFDTLKKSIKPNLVLFSIFLFRRYQKNMLFNISIMLNKILIQCS